MLWAEDFVGQVLSGFLLPGWVDFSRENPDGPRTFLREDSKDPGPLQVSLAAHRAGDIPNPSLQDLVTMASDMGDKVEATEITETMSGECAFGHFGSAVFRSPEHPRMQVWYLSDGGDFIMATHICPADPDPCEVAEAQEIVKGLVVEDRPWWKFW